MVLGWGSVFVWGAVIAVVVVVFYINSLALL